jgi:hypothetical protein
VTRLPLGTAGRDGGSGARVEPPARVDARSEVIIARIVGDRPGTVYSLPVLRLGDQWGPRPRRASPQVPPGIQGVFAYVSPGASSTGVTLMLKFADRLALIALVLAAIAAAAGLLIPGLYRNTAEGIRQARATDLVTLLVAVPALAIGLWRARAGSAAGRLVAVGALAYLAYSYAIYAFSVVIDPLTPAHIAIFGLATWSALLAALGMDSATVDRASGLRFLRRVTGGFLIVVAALFAMLWLSEIAGAITSGHLPTAISDLNLPTSPVFSLDLAFAVPLIALAGGWLIRRDRRGPASAVAGLAFLIILGLSVLAIFAFEAAAGIAVEVPPIVIFGAVTGIAAALLGFALTSPTRETSS